LKDSTMLVRNLGSWYSGIRISMGMLNTLSIALFQSD
jgi:hypothetical protein